MANRKLAFAASGTITITPAALASSSTLVAGRESTSISNTVNLYLDYEIGGFITVGTTPTANTRIEVWVVPKQDDTTWPDVFDGTDSAETVTSRPILESLAVLGATMEVDVNTSSRQYPFHFSILSKLGYTPSEWDLFVVHNTGVNLYTTAAGHSISYKGVYETIT